MTDYLIYIAVVIILAVILGVTRIYVPQAAIAERSVIGIGVGWCIIVYTIILGFSISNFYNRYIEMRQTFIKESTDLQIIYRSLKILPKTEYTTKIINAIEDYTKSIYLSANINLPKKEYCPKTQELYKILNNSIIKYVANSNQNENSYLSFSNNFLMRLNTDIKIKKLVDEMKAGDYYISLLYFLLIFLIIPLWLFKLEGIIIQFLIDFCLLIILFSSLYLLGILNVPFGEKNPIGFNLSMYKDIFTEIENDRNGNIV